MHVCMPASKYPHTYIAHGDNEHEDTNSKKAIANTTNSKHLAGPTKGSAHWAYAH